MSNRRIPSLSLLSSFSRALKPSVPVSSRVCTASCTSLPARAWRSTQQSCVSRPVGAMGSGSASSRAFSSSSIRNYKTVEEQRSRYKSGVCPSRITLSVHSSILCYTSPPSLVFQASSFSSTLFIYSPLKKHSANTILEHSPSPTQPAYSSLPPALVSSSTSATKKRAWSANELQKLQRAWDGRKLVESLS